MIIQLQSLLSSFHGLPPREEPQKASLLLENTRMPYRAPYGHNRRTRILEIIGQICSIGPRTACWSSSLQSVNVLSISDSRWLVTIDILACLHQLRARLSGLASTSVVLLWLIGFDYWLRLVDTRLTIQRGSGCTAHDALSNALIAGLSSDSARCSCT
jgi:hypothetical protein